jgi:hypothetical protein
MNFVFIVLAVMIVFFYLLGKGIKQKFGRFDMPIEQLDIVIYEFLSDVNILVSDLPYLRENLYELGYTDLSKEDIKIELKQILQENNNWN